MKDHYTRWDAVKLHAKLIALLVMIGVIASLLLPDIAG